MTEEKDNAEPDAVDADLVEETDELEPGMKLQLRSPTAPTSVDQIAALGGEGVKIIRARHQIMDTLRKSSIMLTYPDDWLLFKTREGAISGYLQDSGCDRVAPLWGIEVFSVGTPERIDESDGSFCYVVKGSGRCSLTGQVVEDIEGMRASTDDVAKNVTGARRAYIVRKSARANLDGSILRELAGLKRVPLEELELAAPGRKWLERSPKGRGFGSGAERQSEREGDIDLTSPVPPCPKCGGPMWDNRRDKKNPRAPDFKCKKQGGNPECDGAKWLEKKAPTAAPPAQQAAPAAEGEAQSGPTSTAAPSGGAPVANQAEEEARMRKTIKAQFKGKKMDAAAQQELIDEYLEASSKEKGGTIDQLGLDSLVEMHEVLKK